MSEEIKERIDLKDLDLEKFGKQGLPLGLIFMDELRRIRERAAEIAQVPEKELTTIKKENFEKSTKYLVKKIEGLGELRSFVVLAESQDYSVLIKTDNKERVSDSYSDLEALSSELTHLGAYEKEGKYLINVSNYPFRESLKIALIPHDTVLFSELRAEVLTIKRPHLDPDKI